MANQWLFAESRRERALARDYEHALRGGHASRSAPAAEATLRDRQALASPYYMETPIGSDDRVQVRNVATHPSTRLFPFNTICMIRTPTGGIASGTLIAPQVLLTAGHVLRNKASVTITPGADASASTDRERRPATPKVQTVLSSRFFLHPDLDIGLAVAPVPFTRPNEFMMLQPRSDANTATLLTNAGFPGGSTPPPGWSLGTMWRHSDHVPVTGVSPTHLSYGIDTSRGHSGSPLWLLGNGGVRLLLAVHTSGVSSLEPEQNHGVRITCAVIDWIEEQCRAASVTGPRIDRVAYNATCKALESDVRRVRAG